MDGPGFGCGVFFGLICAALILFLSQAVAPAPIEDPTQITILSCTEKALGSLRGTNYYIYTSDDRIYSIQMEDYLRLRSLPAEDFPYPSLVVIDRSYDPPRAILLNFSIPRAVPA